MIQLKDLTHNYIYSQLVANHKEFENINMKRNLSESTHGIRDSHYGQSNLVILDYLIKHDKSSIFENMALMIQFKNHEELHDQLLKVEKLHDKRRKIDFDDEALREHFIDFDEQFDGGDSAHGSFYNLFSFINGRETYFKFSNAYVKCNQLDESHIAVYVVQSSHKVQHDIVELVMKLLFDIRDVLTTFLEYAKEHHILQLEKNYAKALDEFEQLNKALSNQFKAFDVDTFITKEFYICDVELPEPLTSDITDELDSVSKLQREDLLAYEILDPVRSDMILARPKALVEELQDLCNKTIVKRYNAQNKRPYVISSVDAKDHLLYVLSKHSNSARNWVNKSLNERFEMSPKGSRDRKILKHFKESIKPFNEQIIKLYDWKISRYVDTPFNQRLAPQTAKAFTIDLENGNNDAKLEIINDVSTAIDEIEQIVKQLNSAYRDMLVHLYGDEAKS